MFHFKTFVKTINSKSLKHYLFRLKLINLKYIFKNLMFYTKELIINFNLNHNNLK